MAKPTAGQVEAKMNAGERLRVSEVAILLGASRSMVDRWLTNGVLIGGKRMQIGFWLLPGDIRMCDPKDVKAVLVEMQKRRTADNPDGE